MFGNHLYTDYSFCEESVSRVNNINLIFQLINLFHIVKLIKKTPSLKLDSQKELKSFAET